MTTLLGEREALKEAPQLETSHRARDAIAEIQPPSVPLTSANLALPLLPDEFATLRKVL